MDIRTAWKQGAATLRAAGVASPVLAAARLLEHVLGCERAWLYAHPEHPLDVQQLERFRELVDRRAAGEPLQYLTGRQEFWGLDFEVTPAVLIPRPETEHVVEVTLERLGQHRAKQALCVLDVGTGSGCLAVALARELSRARIWAVDLSAAALAVAMRNATRHGVGSRILFVHGDALEAFGDASLDVVVSNPPYVARSERNLLPREVAEHEPALAVFGGADGLEFYPRLINGAARVLLPGGLLVMELGAGLADRVRALCAEPLWDAITVTRDLAGTERVLAAERRRE